MLTFQDVGHVYRWNGVIVPSVSTVMGGLRDFAGIPDDVLDHAAERGSNVHSACHLSDLGTLDESTISDEVRPYLDAWRLFVQKERPLWEMREEALYSEHDRYAGTPDCHGFVLDGENVVEIKSTVALHPAFGVQLSGYRRLIQANRPAGTPPPGRITVQLLRTGKYRVQEYTDRLDDIVFASCLTILNWRSKNG